ncbi:MAG: hypothetical protein JSR74_11260 [Proteobacteria bacterium]|nr:hypothetical protein [Pseudomonadota bacterium]
MRAAATVQSGPVMRGIAYVLVCKGGVVLKEGMKNIRRADIRRLKRAKTLEERQHAALLLLRRSVAYGHPKLARQRFDAAVSIGVEIPVDLLDYFQIERRDASILSV